MLASATSTYATATSARCAMSSCGVGERQLVALTGPNGSGKSTLLKLHRARATRRHSGEVLFEGKPLSPGLGEGVRAAGRISAAGSRSGVPDARPRRRGVRPRAVSRALRVGDERRLEAAERRWRCVMPRISRIAISTR